MHENMFKICLKYAEYAKQYAKYVISSDYDICQQKYAKYVMKYAKYAKYVIVKKICTPHFADLPTSSIYLVYTISLPKPGLYQEYDRNLVFGKSYICILSNACMQSTTRITF